MLERYNFASMIDVGCGKGALTCLLRKKNNYVIGVDVFDTAIQKARKTYGNEIKVVVTKDNCLSEYKENKQFDLTVVHETLSYIAEWKESIRHIS